MSFRQWIAFSKESPARLRLVLLGVTVVWPAILLMPQIPLGVTGEWVWARHALPGGLLDAIDRLLMPVTAAAVLMATVVFGEGVLLRGSRPVVCVLLAGLVASSMFWFHSVQQVPPSPHRDVKSCWVVYDKYASGYFFEAVFRISSAQSLLSGYADRMREGDVLHVGTHPPGLFLISLWARDATESSPWLVRTLQAVRDPVAESAFRDLETGARFERPLTASELAALQLVSLISFFAATIAVVPVYLLGTLLADRRTGWRAASLMILVPAIAVFFPKSDVLYPLTATTCLWLGSLSFCSASAWKRFVAAVAAGCVICLSLILSLAHLPCVVVLALFAAGRVVRGDRTVLRMESVSAAVMFGSFLTTAALWYQLTHCSLPDVWRLNLTNHENFYNQSPRTYWKWLLVNVCELAFSLGLPLFVCAVVGYRRAIAEFAAERWAMFSETAESRNRLLNPFLTATLVTWLLLWLSGKNMGEAARLWCFLMPWLAIAAAAGLSFRKGGVIVDPAADREHQRLWRLVLVLQVITAIVTVGRVNGFAI